MDRWRRELEEIADWLNNDQWPQLEPGSQPDADEEMNWQDLADKMEILAHRSGRSTPTSGNSGLYRKQS